MKKTRDTILDHARLAQKLDGDKGTKGNFDD